MSALDPIRYVLRYGGQCRGCADEYGICPTRGLPCNVEVATKAIKHVIAALDYGTRNGYLTPPKGQAEAVAVTDAMVDAAARALDPDAFSEYERRLAYRGTMDSAEERQKFADHYDERPEAIRKARIALTAALASPAPAGRGVEGWQPMESAPKDGGEFQTWIDKYGWEPKCRFNPITEAFEIWGRVDYDQEDWDVYLHMTPVAWQPAPTAPTTEGE